jgi:hypothetical protein
MNESSIIKNKGRVSKLNSIVLAVAYNLLYSGLACLHNIAQLAVLFVDAKCGSQPNNEWTV